MRVCLCKSLIYDGSGPSGSLSFNGKLVVVVVVVDVVVVLLLLLLLLLPLASSFLAGANIHHHDRVHVC